MISRCIFTLITIILTGCNGISDIDSSPGIGSEFVTEKKYYLKDCLVRFELTWKETVDASARYDVLQEAGVEARRVLISGVFPLFASHYTRDGKYYVLYFADQCENKSKLAKALVEEYFLPNVPNFPEYKIENSGFSPGFDGVVPSGWWIEE